MKKILAPLAAGVASALSRHRTNDVAFPYRMGAGFAGDINRIHPFQSLPGMQNATNPIAAYGFPFLIASDGTYRGLVAADTAIVAIDGVLARPYPTQQFNLTQGLGVATPPLSTDKQILDGLYAGWILTKLPTGQTATKKGAVFIWIATSTGAHVQGGFESVATGGSTIALTDWFFNGPPDAAGITEIYKKP